MDKRELLQAEARGYGKGYAHALEVAQAEKDTRRDEIFEEGRRYQRERARMVEWAKLFTYQVVASVIGCGIILAVAIGLSRV